MTLAKLAKLARIHPSYTADVERGERNLSLLNILKLAAALRVVDGNLVKVLAWYDNEAGYTQSLVMHAIKAGNAAKNR